MIFMKKRILMALAGMLVTASADAGLIKGETAILDGNGLAQLEGWLGQGDLTLTNIFSKSPAQNTGLSFHQAVDGKGPTFVLMKATADQGASWKVFGGYNPRSWTTASTFGPATAFVFNLTDGFLWRQVRHEQTFTSIANGPGFGGRDLVVFPDLTRGRTERDAYGDRGGHLNDGRSLFTDKRHGPTYFTIGELEVFALTPQKDPTPGTPIPEPTSLFLLSVGLLALGVNCLKSSRNKLSKKARTFKL
ncbi:PEP_CTERM-anchored TLD domain-containing protein [Massilia sp. erpn]|uniref:PEP_CTERM-anchored TLD domain-containing protein n=1 Tax=Massilia sp. erpn TaxID=2738142 RepID=UPI002106FBAE|nr:PEP_CTERM-anchored TLD domain-containing protein [Massilia sp. erpn]UTY55921.1 PEP-CTERM sorting domain-containing protein [Massilia sp. erpn]